MPSKWVSTFAPYEFGGVERGDDEEEECCGAFYGLNHKVGNGPNVAAGDASGKVAVVDGEGDEDADERPERNFAKDVGEAKSRERYELAPGRGGIEDLADDGQFRGDHATLGARVFLFMRCGFRGSAFAADSGEGFDGHRE